MNYRPRLLRETAEIALTEIKRFIEPRLSEVLSLRRVSAPLVLPKGSPLNDPYKAVCFVHPATGKEMEIVTGLDRWTLSQLAVYDIAPSFGVFTVMNAVRPEMADDDLHSPQVSGWSWQQALDPAQVGQQQLHAAAKSVYRVLTETENMILGKFPHLTPTLATRFERGCAADCSPRRRAIFAEKPGNPLAGSIVVWNDIHEQAFPIAEIAVSKAPAAVGGTIYRDVFALHILHQPRLINPVI